MWEKLTVRKHQEKISPLQLSQPMNPLKGTDSHDSTPGLVAFLHCLTKYKKHHPL